MDEREQISIALIAIYTPAILVAIFLAFKHGFGRSAGWRYVIVFSLLRIVGSVLQIMTVSNPTSIGLYTGAAVCQSIGVSPLLLTTLGLLGRVVDSTPPEWRGFVTKPVLVVVQITVVVGLVFGIKGGIDAESQFSETGQFSYGSLSKASVALFIIVYVLTLVGAVGLFSPTINSGFPNEKRMLLAISASLPFLLVRIVYSCLSTFTTNPQFSQIDGNPTILLVMALIMEMVTIFLYEVMGLLLRKTPPIESTVDVERIQRHGYESVGKPASSAEDQNLNDYPVPGQSVQGGGRNMAPGIGSAFIGRRGIIGRVIAAAATSRSGLEID